MIRISFLFLLFLLAFPITGTARDSVVVLKQEMFGAHEQMPLLKLDGWQFKQSFSAGPTEELLSSDGWTFMSPLQLTRQMADETGRVEGWFRIALQADSNLAALPLGLRRNLWAATDVYINGEKIYSFGSTGLPYRAFNSVLQNPVPLKLEPGETYHFAFHFVDYETPFTARDNRLNPSNLETLLLLTGPEYDKWLDQRNRRFTLYAVLCNSVAFILFLLFWLLVYLNPEQKVFKYIAVMSSAVLLSSLANFMSAFFELTYSQEKIRFILTNAFFPIMTALTLVVTEWVLKQKISLLTKIILPLLAITSVIGHLYDVSPPFGIVNSIMLGYFGYLIYTSRKTINKTQFVVLVAMVIPTLGGVVYVMLHKYWPEAFWEYDHLVVTTVVLSPPLLLLVYISIRFKEILHDVALEANKVIMITEEKRSLLENQNILLESQVEERTREVMKQKEEAEKQKSISEELLLNILPHDIAEELKSTGHAKAKAFTMVTVMFTDFKDFTSISEKVSAELLVDEIHYCFSAFDNILQKYKIEKIKTIGDAYLCASGIPAASYTHAIDMVNAALEIRDFMNTRKLEKERKGEIPFEIRIGIHTGPVVAGIVGVKKYAYDIWGDTVNMAARMEQNSETGKINISGSTYELVKNNFTCLHRGKINAKNKGETDMYFVERSFSED